MEKVNIPGWNLPDIIRYLETKMRSMPEDAVILEVGAFFGRTSHALAHSKPETAKLITIDPWMTYSLDHFASNNLRLHDGNCTDEALAIIDQHTDKIVNCIHGDDFFNMWKLFVGEVKNHEAIRDYSPIRDREWPMLDFIYHDAAHDEKGVYDDLCFWFPKLKKHGSLVIDDYAPDFPGLCSAVDKFVAENNLEFKQVAVRNFELKRKV